MKPSFKNIAGAVQLNLKLKKEKNVRFRRAVNLVKAIRRLKGGSGSIWQKTVDGQGYSYFYNVNTMETAWSKPTPPSTKMLENVSKLTAAYNAGDLGISEYYKKCAGAINCCGENGFLFLNNKQPSGEDWEQCVDGNGKVYYYNKSKNITAWEKPENGLNKSGLESVISTATKHKEYVKQYQQAEAYQETIAKQYATNQMPAWREVFDQAQNCYYYYNATSMETSWAKPAAYIGLDGIAHYSSVSAGASSQAQPAPSQAQSAPSQAQPAPAKTSAVEEHEVAKESKYKFKDMAEALAVIGLKIAQPLLKGKSKLNLRSTGITPRIAAAMSFIGEENDTSIFCKFVEIDLSKNPLGDEGIEILGLHFEATSTYTCLRL